MIDRRTHDARQDRQGAMHNAFLAAIQKRQAAPGGYGGPSRGGGPGGLIPSAGGLKGYAQQLLQQRGWDAADWDALDRLWEKESNWNPNAVNPSSGAFGIAQILPSAHPTANRNMSAQEQIEWGIDYIARRYGRPLAAWQHSQRTNWY